MHTEKSKRKAKSKVTIKSKEIKKEPKKVYHAESLCHLIDDRVKLIKQIFQTLKSKTIKSMAPDFLQDCTAESLQEYCLDEILGISNKRLVSIIEATQCPTDTDDTDSDVEKIEEHISLEELTSESDTDKRKKKPSKAAPNNKDGGGIKPMSMLELLELQARARAIRSQLALEPVTKIELDSDSETSDSPQPKKTTSKPVAAAAPNAPEPASKRPIANEAPKTVEPAIAAAEPRPIRLKRNFRQRQLAIYEPTSGDEESLRNNETNKVPAIADEPSKPPAVEVVSANGDQLATTQSPVKQTANDATAHSSPTAIASADLQLNVSSTSLTDLLESAETNDRSRSPSPDIVPIISEPPVFCISSDSENEDDQRVDKRKAKLTSLAITINRAETEDEVFLRKVKETAGGAPKNVAEREVLVTQVPLEIQQSVASKKRRTESVEPAVVQKETAAPSKDESEAEEGEISDDEEMAAEELPVEAHIELDSSSDSADVAEPAEEIQLVETEETVVTDDPPSTLQPTIKTEVLELTYRSDDIVDIDDDEDIIDLGKDETLDFDVDPITEPPAADSETAESASWGDRWLRCKKVSNIMATSRLANKVRTKIKQTRAKEAIDLEEAAKNAALEAELLLKKQAEEALLRHDPNVEEGSVDQYTSIHGGLLAESEKPK